MAISDSLPRVGICGLGAMGRGMSNNLLQKGFKVAGYDVVPALLDAFEEKGGQRRSSAKEAAEDVDVLLVIVVNATQVESVLFEHERGAIFGLTHNSAIVISSTVPAAFVRSVRQRLDNEFKRTDIHLLDCPVSGGTSGAASGELTIFACGTDDGLKLGRPVLEAIGSKICRIRDSNGIPGTTGSGANGKVCHQVVPEIAIALDGEVMALAVRAGLNTQRVYDKLQSGEGASWIMENRIPHALSGDESVYSAMTNSQKDSSIIVRTAGELSCPVPLVATAEQVYQTMVHIGWAGMDDSATWRLYLRDRPKDAVRQQTNHTEEPKTVVGYQDLEDILVGVHLAATAESRAFTAAIGLDAEQMYDIVNGAAGWNVQFERYAPRMTKGPWYLKQIPEAEIIGAKLADAVKKANTIGASMPIAAAAVQVFQLQLGPLNVTSSSA